MKYPRLDHDQKLCTKLLWSEILEIKRLYKLGYNRSRLAKQFKVCWKTIKYWTDSDYNYWKNQQSAKQTRELRSTKSGRIKSNQATMRHNARNHGRKDWQEWYKSTNSYKNCMTSSIRNKRAKTFSSFRTFWKRIEPFNRYYPAVRAHRKYSFSFWRVFWKRIENE